MHLRNAHHFQYNFPTLVDVLPALKPFVLNLPNGKESIDFHNPEAVKLLNKALLKHHYNIEHWNIPSGYLCPAVPSRADYIHHLADFLADKKGRIPRGSQINVLDIGVGANGIYPLIGHQLFGWSFVGSDIDPLALNNIDEIVAANKLSEFISVRKQNFSNNIIAGIIQENEIFDLTLSNPPFHASKKEANKANTRKVKNLKGRSAKSILNFEGQSNELWYPGGELAFIAQLIKESKLYSTSVFWFTSLVSKKENLIKLNKLIKEIGATENRTIEMQIGNKTSRIIAWTFLSEKQQKVWRETRWGI